MTSILFANMGHEEDLRIKEAFGNDYDVAIVKSPGELNGRGANQDLVLLDHLFVERYGVDSMTGLMEKSPIPVIFLSSPEDSDGALKTLEQLGSANCIVKTGDYYPLIDYAVRYELERCARERKMKQAIFTLKKRIDELEEESIKSETDTAPPKDINVDMLEQIVFIFKRGEIDLPSHPRLSQKFLDLTQVHII